MTLAEKLAAVTGRISDAADTVRERVRVDVTNWYAPVVRDEPAWRDWLAKELGKRGFAAMSIEARHRNAPLRKLAMALAFELLFDIGGIDAPLLSIPEVLQGDDELTYWRAIAIAANT